MSSRAPRDLGRGRPRPCQQTTAPYSISSPLCGLHKAIVIPTSSTRAALYSSVVPAQSLPRTRYGGDLCTPSLLWKWHPATPHRHTGESRYPVPAPWIPVYVEAMGRPRFHPPMWPAQGHSDSDKLDTSGAIQLRRSRAEPAPYSIRGGDPSPVSGSSY